MSSNAKEYDKRNTTQPSVSSIKTRSCMRTMDYHSQLQMLKVDIKDPSRSTKLLQNSIQPQLQGISEITSVKQPIIKLIDCATVTYCKCCWLPVIGTITSTENGIIEYSENCHKHEEAMK